MATVKVTFDPFTGEYPLDISSFTFRDYHIIKNVSGVRAAEVFDALEAGDMDILVAMVSVALTRAGVRHNADTLFDAPVDAFEIDFSDEEAEVVEDPTMPTGETPTVTSGDANGNASNPGTGSFQVTSPVPGSGIPPQEPTSSPESLTT